MVINKGESGWWTDGRAYKIVSKRRKKLVDGKTHRIVELELIYSPEQKKRTEERLLTTQDWSNVPQNTILVPVGQFIKHFRIDNTIGLLFEKT